MGLDSECGEVSFEDFDSGKLGKIIQEDSDIDRMSKMQVQQDAGDGVPVSLLGNSDDNVPLIQVLDDGTPKTHACPYKDCVKVFSRPWRLARHIHVHTGKRPFKCEVPGCEKTYCHSSYLERHVKVKHNPAPMYWQFYKCPHPWCLKELSNESNLKRHYQRKHKQKYPFICYCCDKGFLKRNQLQAHLYQHTGVPPFKCPTCDAGFTSQSNLKRHQRSHKTYTCECGQEFKYWTLLQAHIKLTHPAEYICDICKKSFKAKCRLRTHMSVHQDVSQRGVLSCPYDNCPRFYYQKRNLVHHIKSSHEGKMYECTFPDCGRKLCTLQKLENHMRLHDGKRPRPQKSLKSRKRRCDAGKVKRVMAVLLSGIEISREEEKELLNNSFGGVVVVNENSRPIRNCIAREEAPCHQSEECKGGMIQKNIEIHTASLHAVQKDGDIAKQVLQNPEAQVKETYDSSLCKSEKFVPSEKDCSEQDSEIKEVAESRVDERQEERYGIDSPNFQMDVKKWVYLVIGVMEEVFPTIKTSCL